MSLALNNWVQVFILSYITVRNYKKKKSHIFGKIKNSCVEFDSVAPTAKNVCKCKSFVGLYVYMNNQFHIKSLFGISEDILLFFLFLLIFSWYDFL